MGAPRLVPILCGSRSLILQYEIGTSGERVILGQQVLNKFARHRQRWLWQSEAGGQIFARFIGSKIVIERVTGPKTSDVRTRYSHSASRHIAQAEVEMLHTSGLHYIGDWHTHPQRRPHPSRRDKMTMASRVRRSEHQLHGMIFIIVGTAAFPAGLKVMVHDGNDVFSLTPSTSV